MDYETFGEHQWESTGIFQFMEALPDVLLSLPGFSFVTPTEAAEAAAGNAADMRSALKSEKAQIEIPQST